MSGAPTCNHGKYADCRLCEIAALQARLAECEQQRDAAMQLAINNAEGAAEYARTIAELRAQLAETQKLLEVQLAVGDKLTAEVARLKSNLAALEDEKNTYIDYVGGVVEIGFRCDGCGRVSGIHKTNTKHPGMTDTDWDW